MYVHNDNNIHIHVLISIRRYNKSYQKGPNETAVNISGIIAKKLGATKRLKPLDLSVQFD